MELQERRRGRRTYYYLVQSYRERGRVRKLERYLGRTAPKDLEPFRAELRLRIFERQWAPALSKAREEYRLNLKKQPPSIREKELETFATRFTYDSNRIEGSSLTLRETALLLSEGITPSNRPLSDVEESLAHQKVFLDALRSKDEFNLQTLLSWHRDLFEKTKPQLAGKIRTFGVRISGSRFEPPTRTELGFLLSDFFRWFRSSWETLHPVVLAALVHYRIVTIHPFGDGNGRVTRIAMNVVLHRKQYEMIDLPYTQRASYYRALERAQMARDDTPFLRWFLRRYLAANSRPLPMAR